jgi:hypothetical protein
VLGVRSTYVTPCKEMRRYRQHKIPPSIGRPAYLDSHPPLLISCWCYHREVGCSLHLRIWTQSPTAPRSNHTPGVCNRMQRRSGLGQSQNESSDQDGRAIIGQVGETGMWVGKKCLGPMYSVIYFVLHEALSTSAWCLPLLLVPT